MIRIAIAVPGGDSQYFINRKYVDYLRACGYIPVLLTETDVDEDAIAEIDALLSTCDGLLLPGGIDIEPTHYGDTNYNSMNCDPIRDEFDRAVMHRAMMFGIPIFGICRGFQLLARQYLVDMPDHERTSLYYEQHLAGHNQTSSLGANRNVPSHSVKGNTNVLYGLDNKKPWDMVFINSIHHQALICENLSAFNKTHAPLDILAFTGHGIRAQKKPWPVVIEAFEIRNFKGSLKAAKGSHIRVVQWHPEEMMDTELLMTFFDEAWAGDDREIVQQE